MRCFCFSSGEVSSKLDPFWPWKPLHLQWKDRKEHKTKHGHCNSGITTMPTTLRSKIIIRSFLSITATSKANHYLSRFILEQRHAYKVHQNHPDNSLRLFMQEKGQRKEVGNRPNQDQAQKRSFLGIVKLPHQQQFWRALEALYQSASTF